MILFTMVDGTDLGDLIIGTDHFGDLTVHGVGTPIGNGMLAFTILISMGLDSGHTIIITETTGTKMGTIMHMWVTAGARIKIC